MNWSFACWSNSVKLKVISVICGWTWWVQSFSLRNPKICRNLGISIWIELIFACWLWCNNFWLNQYRTYILFKCQSTAVELVNPQAVAWRILWNRAYLFFLCYWDLGQNTLSLARFLNQLFLQNKLMKELIFLHDHTNLQKLKVYIKYFTWVWSNIGVAKLVSGL